MIELVRWCDYCIWTFDRKCCRVYQDVSDNSRSWLISGSRQTSNRRLPLTANSRSRIPTEKKHAGGHVPAHNSSKEGWVPAEKGTKGGHVPGEKRSHVGRDDKDSGHGHVAIIDNNRCSETDNKPVKTTGTHFEPNTQFYCDPIRCDLILFDPRFVLSQITMELAGLKFFLFLNYGSKMSVYSPDKIWWFCCW